MSALNEFLAKHHPKAAKALTSTSLPQRKVTALGNAIAKAVESLITDSSSDDEVPAKVARTSQSHSTAPVPPKATPAAKKPAAADSSSDDEAPPRKSAPVPPKATPAAKKPAAADSSSDDEAPAKKAPRTTQPTAASSATKKPAAADSSSDDEPAKKTAPLRKPVADDSSDEETQKKRPRESAGNGSGGSGNVPKTSGVLNNSGPRRSGPGGPGTPFCRIDTEKVKFADERLKDNTPGMEAVNFRQNQLMMAVRGKEFNKHKQKNKAKLYAAGVDMSIRSVKFGNEDSD